MPSLKFSLPKIVLIADDDFDTREIVGAAVSQLGCTCMLAADGDAALALCRETEPDLAILDIMMPGCSGLEVCEKLKRTEAGEYVPVLMLTARDGVQDKVTALEGGAEDYLTKPFNYQELQARVKALLRVRELNLQLQAKNDELRRMQQKLVESERQLVAGQLGGAAAHQLGQPLSAIILNCHLIESFEAGDERSRKALQAIKADARRMVEMLGQLKTADARATQEYYGGMDILNIDKPRK